MKKTLVGFVVTAMALLFAFGTTTESAEAAHTPPSLDVGEGTWAKATAGGLPGNTTPSGLGMGGANVDTKLLHPLF